MSARDAKRPEQQSGAHARLDGGPLATLTRQAQSSWHADAAERVDWATVDTQLFARLEKERASREAAARFAGPTSRWAVISALAVAAAAAFVVTGGADQSTPFATPSSSALPFRPGVFLRAEGDVLAGGAPLAAGAGVPRDVLEARNGRAFFVREEKVAWALESGAKAQVTRAAGALIVALEQGAVEAEVRPVAAGEAFAVDVAGVRVAVRGTQLRVARFGDRAVVDLNSGTIVIGPTPRMGQTIGTVIAAPAHVEFTLRDLSTMRVEHDIGAVRTPLVLPWQEETPVATTPTTQAADLMALVAMQPHPPPAASAPPPREARAVVTEAVRRCYAEQARESAPTMAQAHGAADVVITVSSDVELTLDGKGAVKLAQFDPPLPPAVQACASKALYASRVATKDTSVRVRLEIER
jgi:ferric-dicitrate binding protein FerR (iron transport regulator)